MPRLTRQGLRDALDALAATDPDIARALAEAGYPTLRRRGGGFASLLRAITGQQLSIASAAAIWGRLETSCTERGGITPEAFLSLADEDLRAIGFSRQKTAYARSLASCLTDGTVRLDRLGRMADEAAIEMLIQIKGIGRWTAEIYMMHAHGRPDILPADDLALMVGAQFLRDLEARPTAKELTAMAEAWRPHRTAAAHLLWHYYRHRREIAPDVM